MRLLVPIDLSPASARVLEAAATLAIAATAEIWLLHVAEPDPDFVGYDAGSPAVRDQVAHEHHAHHRVLQSHAQSLRDRGLSATALLIQGQTDATILREAARLQVDLIVMATHGHGAIFDLLIGSISQAVLRASPVPVVMVPAGSTWKPQLTAVRDS